MKNNIKTFPVCAIMIACLILSCQPEENDFRHRLSKLQDKIDNVSAALDHSEGFPEKAGRIDLQIAKFFAEYIAWELDNPEIMKDALMANEAFGDNRSAAVPTIEKSTDIDNQERERRYRFHIDYELSGSMKILDQALHRLEKDAEWPKMRDIQWNQMKYENGYFRINGRPVFSGGFNMLTQRMVDVSQHPEWAEKAETLTRSFLQKMQKLGVGILGAGMSIPGLVTEDGSISTARIQDLVETIQQYDRMGFKVDILFGWGGNRESLEQLWPGITEYYGNGLHLDIDHPGTGVMITRVMAKLMPVMQDLKAIVSWDMANEPFFNFNMWSPYTLQKYHVWLAGQYTTIEELNTVWKTKYTGFRAIPLPKDKPEEECSAGEWYDRVTFHNYRVTSFFKFIQGEMRKYIPDALIHLKAQDNNSLGPRPFSVTDGIDREKMTPMIDLHGVDTRPLPVTEPRMAAGDLESNSTKIMNYDDSLYGFHWLGQSFLYDYLTSLAPHRPVVDFEYHAFSINTIRIPDIRRSHPRAALWMAHLHGLISNNSWYWHRRYGPYPFPADYFMMWLYGSISTQPLIAAEYFQTMLMLNAFAEEVEALAADPGRPVRLLVSKPSYIQNQAHINALHRVYEGSCFHGLRMGFVTEQILAGGGIPKDCKVIIIPDAEYVSEPALQVLKQARQKGVQLVRFGERTTAYDAHGIPHASESIAFLKDVPVFDYAAAPELSRELANLLSPLTAGLPVQVNVVDSHGAFGVMHRQAQVNGNRILLLVNVSDKPVRVQLHSKEGRTVDGYDMLNSEAVQGTGIVMPFQGVRLIRVSL